MTYNYVITAILNQEANLKIYARVDMKGFEFFDYHADPLTIFFRLYDDLKTSVRDIFDE